MFVWNTINMYSSIFFLLDYDNIRFRSKRQKPLNEMIEDIVRLLDTEILSQFKRAQIRLYGGWYSKNTMTKLAQNIFIELINYFPNTLRIIHDGHEHRIILNVELIYGTAIEPRFHLLNTYREKSYPKTIRCRHPHDIGCLNNNCSALPLYKAFKNKECNNRSCVHPLDSLLYISEQKLVDTMIALDLVHFSLMGNKIICLVSSDEDFWPSIRSAMYYGSKIILIQTLKNNSAPLYYYKDYVDYFSEITI